MDPSPNVTALLCAVGAGDEEAIDKLFAVLYDDLRLVAQRQLAGRGAPQTLTPTVVVHEVYLKLQAADQITLHNRNHFLTLAARAMRQVLVDHARARLAGKRGGGARRTLLDENQLRVEDDAASILELDSALTRLEAQDGRLVQLVSLRFFGGLSAEETAEVMGITTRTLRRDWRKARAYLYADLYGDDQV